MQIPTPQLDGFDGCKEEILEAIGIDAVDVSDLPFILLDNGYLFISVNSLDALWKINPDYKKLKELSNKKKEFFDIAVYTTETIEHNSSAHLRFFAPYNGIDEDPVTGSACGPLLLVLIKQGLIKDYINDSFIKFEQGDVLNRRGRVEVRFNSKKNELSIAGNAVTVFTGKLSF
jgi:PhzF family phenazine biosynthesis protein